MLDIRLIREKPDFVRERLATRGDGDEARIDEVLRIDAERRKSETELQRLQSERNRLSKEIGARRSRKEPSEELEAEVRKIREQIAGLTQRANALDEEQRNLLLDIPNLPHASVPIGKDPSANRVVRSWGEKPQLTNAADHVALGTRLNLFNLEWAAKLSGSGFICFTGAGAKLERALINFMLDLHTREHGYFQVSPPFLVRRDCMIGTTQLPKFEADMYGLEENQLFLAPTAEVQLTNLHREEILSVGDLPKKFTAYTPCFRREAGAAGRDTRGIIRVHQFDKVELVKIVAPEKSYEELESLTADAERVLQLLGLHYRVVELCTGDLGFRLGQNLRHRSLVAGVPRRRDVSRSLELLELRRFPGAPDAASVQRSRREKPLVPHVEWFGSGVAEIVRCADRELSAARWLDTHSGKVTTLLRRGEDWNDE